MAEPTTHWQHYAYAATASNGQVLAAITGGGSLSDLVRVDRSNGHTQIHPFASGGRVRVVGDLEVTGSLHGIEASDVEALPIRGGALTNNTLWRDSATSYLRLSGGSTANSGGQVRVYGESNPSAAGEVRVFSDSSMLARFYANGDFEFSGELLAGNVPAARLTGMTDLPTSNPGGSGNLWRDSNGFLRIT